LHLCPLPCRSCYFPPRELSHSPNRYGIEGIAATYEDPFGVAKIDINMDDIVEDTRREVEVLLTAWETQGPGNGGIFRPRVGEQTMSPRSDNSSDYEIAAMGSSEETVARNRVRFVVSDLSGERYKDDDTAEVRGFMPSRLASAVSPGTIREETGSDGSQYFDVA
jgi:ion channel-forming bestrophin family protein